MAKFVVEFYEIHIQEMIVEAANPQDAKEKVKNGEGVPLKPTLYVRAAEEVVENGIGDCYQFPFSE